MGLVTTTGKYCFIECDRPACTKKIEHIDPEQLKQLVKLCGWQGNDEHWICPACAAILHEKAPAAKQKRKSIPQRAKRGVAR